MKQTIVFPKKLRWVLHLILFLVAQYVFQRIDGPALSVFSLNDIGEKAYSYLHSLAGPVLPYEANQLNYLTVMWLIAVILHGLSCFGKRSVEAG